MREKTFKKHDLGCFIDGAFGQDHRRDKIVSLVEITIEDYDAETKRTGESKFSELINALEGEPSDDLAEEDEAVEILQASTEEGLVWIWETGDLILTTEENAKHF